MHIRILLLLCAALATLSPHCRAASEAGTWHAHMAYKDITYIAKGGSTVFVLASGNLYHYDTADGSITTYDKINALSDGKIKFIRWSDTAKRLLVVYANGNMDIIDRKGGVTNLADYYNKTTTLDKTINYVNVCGDRAFLSTNFGVVAVNVSNATIADTYVLGTPVTSVAMSGNTLYAATADKVLGGSLGDNLADKSSWAVRCDRGFTWLFWKDGTLLGASNRDLCTIDDSGQCRQLWTPWASDCVMTDGSIIFFGGNEIYVYRSPNDMSIVWHPATAIAADRGDGSYWTTDRDGSLCNMSVDSQQEVSISLTGLRPDGPDYNWFGFMTFANNRLYTCGGYPTRKACIQILEDGEWQVYDDSFATTLNNRYYNAYSLAIDPSDPDHVYMGAESGLYEFRNGTFVKQWNKDNAPLGAASSSRPYDYTKVTAVCYTADGRLYGFNSEAKTEKHSLFSLLDGTWTEHNSSSLWADSQKSLAGVTGMMEDSRHLLWFCNNHHIKPCLVGYQQSTDALQVIKDIVNQDGVKYTIFGITCTAEDHNGNIWIGTDVGPFMLEPSQIGSDSPTFTQVKIPRNDGTNLADYLLSNVSISCICIDGAGRKWLGTNGNGVYLISEDNIEQLQHFTRDNSPLTSDNIEAIAINDHTGEVFFSTGEGLCSYMSDATQPNEHMDKDNVYAYPNPVTPDYTGMITVCGLSMNADVKIATANGTIVAQGRSNGGTFRWDGRDSSGKRVASGIYMVMTAKEDGSKGTVCKIAVVN